MARNDCYSAESFYFCGVKSYMRHEVAGYASVFRANNLEVKSYPDECGSSNAHKGLAYNTLTARIGILYCQKVMQSNKENELQDAQQKVVESIQEYLSDFHSLAVMHERTAKALIEIIRVSSHLSEEARKMIRAMVEDHVCLLDLIKPLDEKGGEV